MKWWTELSLSESRKGFDSLSNFADESEFRFAVIENVESVSLLCSLCSALNLLELTNNEPFTSWGWPLFRYKFKKHFFLKEYWNQIPLCFLKVPVFMSWIQAFRASGYCTQRIKNMKNPWREFAKQNKYWNICFISPMARAPNIQLTPNNVMTVNAPRIWDILTEPVNYSFEFISKKLFQHF